MERPSDRARRPAVNHFTWFVGTARELRGSEAVEKEAPFYHDPSKIAWTETPRARLCEIAWPTSRPAFARLRKRRRVSQMMNVWDAHAAVGRLPAALLFERVSVAHCASLSRPRAPPPASCYWHRCSLRDLGRNSRCEVRAVRCAISVAPSLHGGKSHCPVFRLGFSFP